MTVAGSPPVAPHDGPTLLVTVTGRDRPGITTALLEALAPLGVAVLDVEQVTIRDRLVLGLLVSADPDGGSDPRGGRDAVAAALDPLTTAELTVEVAPGPPAAASTSGRVRHVVTLLGHPLSARALGALTGAVTAAGANIDRVVRLSRWPVTCFELTVSGGDADALRSGVARCAAGYDVDAAVQRHGLARRAQRLVVVDVDSTLVQGEVIELLAERAGCAEQVAAVTAAAMRGDLDFEASLHERVALLAGLPVGVVDEVRAGLRLMPGARTLVRTLRRLGISLAAVSGGFTQVLEPLAAELGIAYTAANTLEVVDGVLTGCVVGPVVDRAGKAAALRRFAALAGVPLAQTVAVGDGANDLDMLAAAGLGIAFNAKPVVRAAADAAVSAPYLDSVLLLLGIPREEVEAADAEGR